MNDPLTQAARVSVDIEGDGHTVLLEQLGSTAEQFLRSGGVLSLQDWALLGDDSRAAFVVAGERLSIERAVVASIAGLSPESALAMSSALDGGDLQQQTACELIVQKMAQKGKKNERS